jgi:FkbM family methyltransferase
MSLCYLLCYCKAIIRAIIKDIKSKIETINALRTIYGFFSLIKLLLFCIMRKPTIIKVNPIGINMKLVNWAASVMLARTLYNFVKFKRLECNRYITVEHGKLCLRLDEELECFDVVSLSNNLKEVLSLYSTNIVSVDNKTILVKKDDIYWYIRRRSLDDISAPLLPLISEPYEYSKWFKKIVKEDSNFVDVGAFLGGYAIRAAKRGAKVLAFEPSQSNYLILERNISFNDLKNKITTKKLAIGSTREKRPLYSDGLFNATFSLTPSLKIIEYVEVTPLDEVMNNNENKLEGEIDLLKIDVEGAEVDVLKGASKTLKRTRYVMVEVLNSLSYDHQNGKIQYFARKYSCRSSL